MGIVINDFEVVVEKPEDQPDVEGTAAERPSAPLLSPQDIGNIMRRQAERLARITAH
jgi:hypothetical protein